MKFAVKIRTIVWFLKRPVLYPQLWYLFLQRIYPSPKEKTRDLATKWCKEKSVSSHEAIKMFTGLNYVEPLNLIFKDFYDQAYKIINSLPVKMGGGGDVELLYYLARHWKPKTMVETGVAYGWSSSALLLASRDNADTTLYSTDMPYPKMNNEDFVGCIVPNDLKKKWALIRLPDRQAFKKIFKKIQSIDLCHYDSDKSYRGRMWAYPFLWSHLRAGGLFISDDINDNTAFLDFAERVGEIPTIVFYEPEQKFIGILVKPSHGET